MTPRTIKTREPLTAILHLIHLLITLATCGLWLPGWIAVTIIGKRTTTTVTPVWGLPEEFNVNGALWRWDGQRWVA
ncbi:hypothetical protein SAMN05421837_109321 [Amycolatopsis pretoriensis]|uniref:DUF2510 domain-containing protein n=1 Tax=Amycolatopsis pretoriensis TaxID=218821 RepID=A0A1H5RDP8_9PSEU|nr:hypothetical protein [Amycolatopsis pretoriensis]SEF36164.1 hypothetical protein SAMN05421837_109321 [Amycolatopsis pretoriensis]